MQDDGRGGPFGPHPSVDVPVAEIVGEGAEKTLKVSDQRFSDPLVGDRFSMFFPIGVESK